LILGQMHSVVVILAQRRKQAPSKHAGPVRVSDHSELQEQFKQVDAIFQKHDTDHRGALNRDQLKALMVETNYGQEVNDGEVDDVLKLYGLAKDGEIQQSEAYVTIKTWIEHVKARPRLEPLMLKYDTDSSGRLDKAQLKSLLIDLNNGAAVEDSEVDWVMVNADKLHDGQIGRLELEQAISLWYFHVKSKNEAYCCSIS